MLLADGSRPVGDTGNQSLQPNLPPKLHTQFEQYPQTKKKEKKILADVQIYVCNYNVSLKSPHCVVFFFNPSVNIYIVYFFCH